MKMMMKYRIGSGGDLILISIIHRYFPFPASLPKIGVA
jgi:hypothetical protein